MGGEPMSIFITLIDLGLLDDNVTLPIISGGRLLGFLKLLGMAASWLTSS
jgi:diacylglycerol kinase (CTP)